MNEQKAPFTTLDVERVERLNSILLARGRSIELDPHNPRALNLLDCEGEKIAFLPEEVTDAVLGAIPDDGAVILEWFHGAVNRARNRGYATGRRDGRAEICSTVQELLGIEKIVEGLTESRR